MQYSLEEKDCLDVTSWNSKELWVFTLRFKTRCKLKQFRCVNKLKICKHLLSLEKRPFLHMMNFSHSSYTNECSCWLFVADFTKNPSFSYIMFLIWCKTSYSLNFALNVIQNVNPVSDPTWILNDSDHLAPLR